MRAPSATPDPVQEAASDEPRAPAFETEAGSAEELAEATAGGLPWMMMSRVGSELVLLISMVALARLIPPNEFGAFAVALIVAGLAVGIPAAGVGMALVQREKVSREHLQTGNALALISAVVLGCLTWLLSYPAASLVGEAAAHLIRLSCPLFLLTSVGTVSMALLQRRLDFRRLALMEISGNLARAATSLTLAAAAGLEGEALVLGMLAGTAVTSAIALLGAPPPLPRLRRGPARDISQYGLPASLATIAWTGFLNGDYAVIAARLGTAAAGQYWRAYTLAVGYQSKISVVMRTMAFPVLSRSATQDDLFALRSRMIRLLTVVLFPLLAGLAITAPIVVPAIYGSAWHSAVGPTQVLCIGGAATLVIDALGAVLMATGRARALLGYGVAHFLVYVGSVVLVAPLGLVAVAIDGAIVHGAFALVAYAMIVGWNARAAVRALWGDIGPATVGCAALLAAAIPVDGIAASAGVSEAARFCATGATGAFAYLLTVRVGFESSWNDLMALVRRLVPAALRPRWLVPRTAKALGGAPR